MKLKPLVINYTHVRKTLGLGFTLWVHLADDQFFGFSAKCEGQGNKFLVLYLFSKLVGLIQLIGHSMHNMWAIS